MQSRKDLLQAHRLMTQRAALALLQAEPDPPDQPLRRLNVGLLAGTLVAVMVAAAAGVWGLLAPGHAQGLQAPGTLLIDRETGTSYIWCQQQRLCPVVNSAAARLALGLAEPAQRLVTQASLTGFARGPLIGIPGLPQPLPDGGSLIGGPWSVCVQAVTDPATLRQHQVTTLVAGSSVGGQPVAGSSMLLVTAGGTDWVVWQGERLRIPAQKQSSVLSALKAREAPQPVPPGWLDALPEGPDFVHPSIPGFGQRVRGPGGGAAQVGQVFRTSGAAGEAGQYYVLLPDGLAPITQAQARLLDFAAKQLPEQLVSPSVVGTDRSPASVPSPSGMPDTMPSVISASLGAPLCEVYQATAAAPPGGGTVTVGGQVPAGGVPAGGRGVDQVALPPGKAALVGVVAATSQGPAAPEPAITGYFLVTGGRRYGLASPGVAQVLGYRPGARVLLPAGVLDLIPAGPAFDPALAKSRVTG